MIIIGYQGIGKSTLCKDTTKKYIDLESGNFWVNGHRHDDWYKIYANIAEHLSSQGCVVFTSSHEVVRNALRESSEPVYIVHPSLNLKDIWISKLKNRYEFTKLDKDYKAWKNAESGYDEQIQSLIDDPIQNIEIMSKDYDLKVIIDSIKNKYVLAKLCSRIDDIECEV